jgi:hypothetical protein
MTVTLKSKRNDIKMIPLSYVPEVEWIEIQNGFRSGDWIVFDSRDSSGRVSMYGALLNQHTSRACYWSTLAQAKRYAEIQIYSANILKDLVHQLAKTSQEI